MSNLEQLFSRSSYNRNRTPYNGVSKFLVDTSRLNIDGIPARYSRISNLTTDHSNLNIDFIPTKYRP